MLCVNRVLAVGETDKSSLNVHSFFLPPSTQNSNYESIQQTASSIAEQAHELAYDPNYMSPFAQFACDNGLNVRGKSDRAGRSQPSCMFPPEGSVG